MVSLIVLAPGAVVLSVLLYGVGIVVYNLFFHPYAKYPGPFWAKITPLYSVWHAYIGDLHIDVLRCHEKYGELTLTIALRVAKHLLIYIQDRLSDTHLTVWCSIQFLDCEASISTLVRIWLETDKSISHLRSRMQHPQSLWIRTASLLSPCL